MTIMMTVMVNSDDNYDLMTVMVNLQQGLLPLGSSRKTRESGEVLRWSPTCRRDSCPPAGE